MRVENDSSLAKYTTLRVGGTARTLWFPETKEELRALRAEFPAAPILGGGSNLLINDRRVFEDVICLREFDASVRYESDGTVSVGSGLPLSRLISDLNAHGQGGIEYLCSVPGLVGGAIVMNAGRGKQYHQQISDYLLTADYLDDGTIQTLEASACRFGFRSSVFQERNGIILSARFRFDSVAPEEGARRCRERMELVRKSHDNRYPNAGTTFCEADPKIMKLFSAAGGRKAGGIRFSDLQPNRLQNRGGGTFAEAEARIAAVEKMHARLGKSCRLEYAVWR